MDDTIILYQDRTKDDDKSGKRWGRDKELLLIEHKKDPVEPRTLFYLAQTCSCLNDIQDAFYYYKMRTTVEGFQEEKFHSFLRCGDLSLKLGHDWHSTLSWYMKAVEHSLRAEPLIKISDYYKFTKNWSLAYIFIKLACTLNYPSHCILFVDKRAYDYDRWHLMSIVGFYSGNHEEGKNACLIAIENSNNKKLDEQNLKHYLNKEGKEGKEGKGRKSISTTKIQSKKDYISAMVSSLKTINPNTNQKTLEKIALKRWKNRKM